MTTPSVDQCIVLRNPFWDGWCVFRPANTCLRMRSHCRKRSKTFKNHEKSTFFIMHTRGSSKAHKEKQRKMKKKVCWSAIGNKIPNEQPALSCQPVFGSHSQSLTNKLFSSFFFVSLLCASRVHNEKGIFYSFSSVYDCFQPCECMRKHAFSGRNTQQMAAMPLLLWFAVKVFFFFFFFF